MTEVQKSLDPNMPDDCVPEFIKACRQEILKEKRRYGDE